MDCLATSAATRGLLVSGFQDAGVPGADSDGEEGTGGNAVDPFVLAVFVVLAASEALVALVALVALAGAGKRAHAAGPAQSAINEEITALDAVMVRRLYHVSERSREESGALSPRNVCGFEVSAEGRLPLLRVSVGTPGASGEAAGLDGASTLINQAHPSKQRSAGACSWRAGAKCPMS